MSRAPNEMWAYVCDTDSDGADIWCLAQSLSDIPDDQSGQKIAKYKLERTATFIVSRSVK